MADFRKMDAGLTIALRAFEQAGGNTGRSDGIGVTLKFEGDLAAIEALGFETHMVEDDEALGIVSFRDLPALTAHPGVLWLAAGIRPTTNLDTAARDIRARASSAPVVSAGDGLWHPDSGIGYDQLGKATGKEVIVAVLDTGIAYDHPMFMSRITPKMATRILRIWDQGLKAERSESGPDKALLASNKTYGVEYTNHQIDDALNTVVEFEPVRHRDCNGHGTHVAGIAAGGRLQHDSIVGIAPEAHIIAVKLIDNEVVKYFAGPGLLGDEVGWKMQFRDAVLYCLRTARGLEKPIVINMSFGDNTKPGDGLDEESVWLDKRMNPSNSEDGPTGLNFPKGAIVVKSAGNDGDSSQRRVARIAIPAGGTVVVPLELKDTRGIHQKEKVHCKTKLHKPTVSAAFWFRRPAVPNGVKFALRLPGEVDFSADIGTLGALASIVRFFKQVFGLEQKVAAVSPGAAAHKAELAIWDVPGVAHPSPSGSFVERSLAALTVSPKVVGETASYAQMTYEVQIQAAPSAGTEVFVMCQRWSIDHIHYVGFELGPAIDPLSVTSEYSSGDPMGQHAITVAAYGEGSGLQAPAIPGAIASFSSRGPARDFSDPAAPLGPIAPKPDIAAPGLAILSAGIENQLVPIGSSAFFARYAILGGTSMAAPMVAGAVALLLDKNKGLSTTEVRDLLKDNARAGSDPAPSVPDATSPHRRAYGGGRVDALKSHSNTTKFP